MIPVYYRRSVIIGQNSRESFLFRSLGTFFSSFSRTKIISNAECRSVCVSNENNVFHMKRNTKIFFSLFSIVERRSREAADKTTVEIVGSFFVVIFSVSFLAVCF